MNVKKILGLICLIFSLTTTLSAQQLSDESKVYLLTIAPGAELWSFAGHTAIRVKDPVQNIDVNFNYGVFDFRTESFYFKFLRGTLPYQIGAYNFNQEVPYWFEEGRTVTAQELNLTLGQKQRVYDYLMNNYQPENREYKYKFFYDNCSSRVRDVMKTALGDSLQFDSTLNNDRSFRSWIREYSQKSQNYWSEFGMDILIGIPSDEITGAERAMFLPDNLMHAFDSATVVRNDSIVPFVANKVNLNQGTLMSEASPIRPFAFFSFIFLILALFTFREFQHKVWFMVFDKIYFSLMGLFGLFLVFLWFFTDHGVTSYNLNLLWCLPIVLPAAIVMKRHDLKQWIKTVFLIQTVAALIYILGFNFLHQQFHIATLPIAAITLVRSALIWRKQR